MKKLVFILIMLIAILLSAMPIRALEKEVPEVVILSTTNEQKDGFAVLEEGWQNQSVQALINNSFMKKSLQIYSIAQKYSNTKGEPFYLTFKPNSGEYGRIGFYLKKGGTLIDKTSSPYIELNTEELTSSPARLQSLTQIFPHEMGHVLVGMTVPSMKEEKMGSLEMHNSNVITQYSTAFHEGFAEHFEIISRQFEENKELKDGIYQDMEQVRKTIGPILSKAERDFDLPLRLGYFRSTAFFWVNKAEGLRREQLPVNGEAIYKNSSRQFNDTEKTILYRKMGFKQDLSQKRSLQQCLSTESVISSFFLRLYKENSLPMLEHYSKVLEVFSKHVGKDEKPPLIQFVRGYALEHPEEKEKILKIYREAVGYDFFDEMIPELWMISKGNHIRMAMDQFGAVKLPLYIFNINTCEVEDLLKLDGMKRSEAEKIIRYRDRIRFFNKADDFNSIEGIQEKTRAILLQNSYGIGWTQEEVENLLNDGNGQLRLSFSAILLKSLTHLFFKTMILFILFMTGYYFLVLRGKGSYVKKGILQYLKFILYVLAGLISTVLSMAVIKGNAGVHPVTIFAIMIGIIELVKLPFLIRNRQKLRDSWISTLMMGGMVIYSLI
ncbi:MAG: helix-hairpin-helix domain-containing protein [Clostridia bacterium]|nr:helix-hairpin-helix domain-containing protein [Clostridia bacterium]